MCEVGYIARVEKSAVVTQRLFLSEVKASDPGTLAFAGYVAFKTE